MKVIRYILVVALLICIVEGRRQEDPQGLWSTFAKEFIELMRSLQSTEAGSKLYRKMYAEYYQKVLADSAKRICICKFPFF